MNCAERFDVYVSYVAHMMRQLCKCNELRLHSCLWRNELRNYVWWVGTGAMNCATTQDPDLINIVLLGMDALETGACSLHNLDKQTLLLIVH